MRVAVTGSSGLIGSALVERLRRAGHEVLPVRRGRPEDPRAMWDSESGWVRPGAFEGVEAVVHLAGANIGAKRWTARRKRELRSSRVEATRGLIEGLAAQGVRPAVWVQASGVDYYGGRGEERLDESAGQGEGFLAQLVADTEAEALHAEELLGSRVVLARTAFVIDRTAPAFKRMTRPIKFGVGGPLGSGRQWFPWIHLHDHVRAYEFLLTSDVRGPVNMAAPETLTSVAMTRLLGRVLHRPTVFPTPPLLLKVVLGEMAQPLLLDSKRVVPRVLSEAGFRWDYPTALDAVREAAGKRAASARDASTDGDASDGRGALRVDGGRGLHRLEATQRLPVSLEEAWDFFADPRNLGAITPPDMGFVIQHEVPAKMHPGLVVEYQVRPLFGIPLSWVTEITHLLSPGTEEHRFFVDEQRIGPYRFWHHQHHFEAVEGGVEVRDIVSYDVGFGPVGDLVNALVVRRRLRGIFEYRRRVLEERFGVMPSEG